MRTRREVQPAIASVEDPESGLGEKGVELLRTRTVSVRMGPPPFLDRIDVAAVAVTFLGLWRWPGMGWSKGFYENCSRFANPHQPILKQPR